MQCEMDRGSRTSATGGGSGRPAHLSGLVLGLSVSTNKDVSEDFDAAKITDTWGQ